MEAVQHTAEPVLFHVQESWKVAFHRFKAFHRAHNHRLEHEPPRSEYDKPLRLNVLRAAEHILRLYLQELTDLSKLQEIDPNNLPPYRTRNAWMASTLDVSPKTMETYRKILLACGFFTKEVGACSTNLYWYINPALLLKDHAHQMWTTYRRGVDSVEKEPFPASEAPQKSTTESNEIAQIGEISKKVQGIGHDHQDLKNNTKRCISGVHEHSLPEPAPEASASAKQDQCKTTLNGKVVSDSAQEKNRAEAPETNKKTGDGPAPAPAESREKWQKKHKGGIKPPDLAAEHQAWKQFVMDCVQKFWTNARFTLYPYQQFRPEDERIILNIIWREVFGSGQKHYQRHDLYKNYLNALNERLKLARNYADAHPGFKILPPDLYFRTDGDTRGRFVATEKWLVNNRREAQWQKITRELSKWRKGKLKFLRNKMPYVPSKTEMLQRHKQQLERFGDKALYQRWLAFNANNPTAYQRSKSD